MKESSASFYVSDLQKFLEKKTWGILEIGAGRVRLLGEVFTYLCRIQFASKLNDI